MSDTGSSATGELAGNGLGRIADGAAGPPATGVSSTLRRIGARAWPFSRGIRSARGGDRLLLVPQSLRTLDPSFKTELDSGCLGLAGSVAAYGGGSPFAILPPTDAWARALHNFSWLSHLRASDEEAARDLAEEWVHAWIAQHRTSKGIAWEDTVAARRLINLLANSAFVLAEPDARLHATYLDLVNRHLTFLHARLSMRPASLETLTVATATLYGALCIAEQEGIVDAITPLFCDLLVREILPDGSSVNREATAIVELLLDLLPLERCFTSRDFAAPEALRSAIARAIRYVDHMRLGDGMLARFNGVGPTWPDRLAAVLAYRDVMNPPIEEARYSGYVRLARGASTAIVDVGVPPPFEASASAHAGCLSFEFSAGTAPIVVNCGAPGPADTDWVPLARGTAAHSTLTLNDASSSVLVRDPVAEARLGGIPIEGPERVERVVRDDPTRDVSVTAWHDGYLSRFGMRHERILTLAPDGRRLRGLDRVSGSGRLFAGRGKAVQPFALRFHLHPRTRVRRGETTDTVEIALPGGEIWELASDGHDLHLEESVFLAELSGPLQTIQLVIRSEVSDQKEIDWVLEHSELAAARRAAGIAVGALAIAGTMPMTAPVATPREATADDGAAAEDNPTDVTAHAERPALRLVASSAANDSNGPDADEPAGRPDHLAEENNLGADTGADLQGVAEALGRVAPASANDVSGGDAASDADPSDDADPTDDRPAKT
ncbi:MAG: heparinase II/III family protein [Pseudomonadota bacterium]